MALKRWWLPPVLALAAAAGLVLVGWQLPLASWITGLADRARGAGTVGVLLFTAAYVISTVALLPGSLLTVAAGFAYGPVGGLLVASPASVAGAHVRHLRIRVGHPRNHQPAHAPPSEEQRVLKDQP